MGYNGDSGLGKTITLYQPQELTISSSDEIYISDTQNSRIRKLTCIYYNCGGILSSNGTVCSSRGSCIADNTCQCNSGYFGDNCQFVKCYSNQIGMKSASSRLCKRINSQIL